MEPLRMSFVVACSPEHAFDTWALRTAIWWPAGHTVNGEDASGVEFEPRVGGRIYERAPDGTEHEWGEVLAWEPPHRLAYLWHLMFDRRDATEVEITFEASDGGTLVTIEHRGWERLGDLGAERRERNLRGWSGLLPHFVEVAEG